MGKPSEQQLKDWHDAMTEDICLQMGVSPDVFMGVPGGPTTMGGTVVTSADSSRSFDALVISALNRAHRHRPPRVMVVRQRNVRHNKHRRKGR